VKQILTTGQAAKICRVSQQTIIRCFDGGQLHGFRVPGSRFRRIPVEALRDFMVLMKLPAEWLDAEFVNIIPTAAQAADLEAELAIT